jgi:hypothetical protein
LTLRQAVGEWLVFALTGRLESTDCVEKPLNWPIAEKCIRIAFALF